MVGNNQNVEKETPFIITEALHETVDERAMWISKKEEGRYLDEMKMKNRSDDDPWEFASVPLYKKIFGIFKVEMCINYILIRWLVMDKFEKAIQPSGISGWWMINVGLKAAVAGGDDYAQAQLLYCSFVASKRGRFLIDWIGLYGKAQMRP